MTDSSDKADDTPLEPGAHRPLKSYVLRAQRLTPGQQRGITELLPQWGIPFDGQPLNLEAIFGRKAPLIVEIGFGNGESLAAMAATDPDSNFLGIEVHTPGVGRCLLEIERLGISNLRVMHHDAVEVLTQSLAAHSIDRLQLYFPDPWHKKRHHKRRIVRDSFVSLVAEKLKRGGIWHLATDWQNYAEQMQETLDAAAAFSNEAGMGGYSPKPNWRPQTKFETRGERLGHGVWDLLYRLK